MGPIQYITTISGKFDVFTLLCGSGAHTPIYTTYDTCLPALRCYYGVDHPVVCKVHPFQKVFEIAQEEYAVVCHGLEENSE